MEAERTPTLRAGERTLQDSKVLTTLALIVFFVSGFSALLDQVVWQRILGLFSGADLYSATLVVGAFMAGLGFGSLAGGHLADRVRPATALFLFAAAELAVGLFGLASKTLYYDVLYLRFGSLTLSKGGEALFLFGALLLPTFAMGLSLPLLARSLTRTVEVSARTIGRLYGINALGAGVGAAVTTWVLVRQLGLSGSLPVGAAGNLLCAAAGFFMALAIRRRSQRGQKIMLPQAPRGSTETEISFPLPTWIGLYALSGFIALSLEILWFRLLGIMAKSTTFTFGTLLAIYLGGLGLGVLVGARAVVHSRRPATAFLMIQGAAGLSAGLGLAAFLAFLGNDSFDSLRSYFGQPEPLDVTGALAAISNGLSGEPISEAGRSPAELFLATYLILPALLVGPPTLLMGASFPFLQKAVQTDLLRLGRRVGWLQGANIVGSLAGAILTGLVFLEVLGTPGTLRLLVAASGVFVLLAARSPLTRRTAPLRYMTVAAAVLVAVGLLPYAPRLWSKLHGTSAEKVLFAEDGSGLSLIKDVSGDRQGLFFLFGNGLSQSWLPYGSGHTLLGAIPVLVHPAPADVAVIGLGSGDTLFHLGARVEVRRMICVEIIASQRPVLEALTRAWTYQALRSILSDRRVRFVDGDGRAYLRRSGRRFDLIEADALRPSSALSGNVYSIEYFGLLRERLKPGGIAVTWTATGRVLNSFVRVFPHVVWIGDVLMGSNEPIPFDPGLIRARLADPWTRSYLSRAGGDVPKVILDYLGSVRVVRFGPDHDRGSISDVNTDLFPKDEYHIPQK